VAAIVTMLMFSKILLSTVTVAAAAAAAAEAAEAAANVHGVSG
jgi:hypothetical protein